MSVMGDASVQSMYAPPGSFATGDVDDLSKLESLTNEILLQELLIRYGQDKIYTYVTDILVAVNPFKTLPIYSDETIDKYNSSAGERDATAARPHLFAIADTAYTNIGKLKKNQCVIISGESGAGKTESAKYVIRAILKYCDGDGHLEQSILQISPVLEAFGNAQTIINDNSSRFGKYTRLLFDADSRVLGIQMAEYLLERARVVEQREGERNFHVFYYLFSSPNCSAYDLTDPSAYGALTGGLWPDNAARYAEMCKALQDERFSMEDISGLESILASILHLCNIEMIDGKDDGIAYLVEKSKVSLASAARLLQVNPEQLEASFLGSVNITRGEKIRRNNNKMEAGDCRDALSKSLYGRLFSWIVLHMNESLSPPSANATASRPGVATSANSSFEIGVLDIFGFENFPVKNSFEQMCINLAHEQLQGFFNKHTFQLELEEYAFEGVNGASVSFTNNEPLLNMFFNRPGGLLVLLDEESLLPKTTDTTLIAKLDKELNGQLYYKKSVVKREYPSFSIAHFPGEVEYNATNFLEKNRDNLANAIIEVMCSSTLPVVNDLFNAAITQTGQLQITHRKALVSTQGKPPVAVKSESLFKSSKLKAPSLSVQFRNSLNELVERMSACQPHFIRCMKPNHRKQPNDFISDLVKLQLKYTGVLETVRIRREGYCYRPTFAEFVRRFKLIGFPVTKLAAVQENALTGLHILKVANVHGYLTGKNKFFMRFAQVEFLEAKLKKFYTDVVKVQGAVRAYFARKLVKRLALRARMSKEAKAKSDAEFAAQSRANDEERMRREQSSMNARIEEVKQLAIKASMDKERAEQEARIAEESRLSREAVARTVEFEHQKMMELHLAETARTEAALANLHRDRALSEVGRSRAEIQQMLLEAEQRRSDLESLELENSRKLQIRIDEIALTRAEADFARQESESRSLASDDLSKKLMQMQREAQEAKEEKIRLDEEHRKENARLRQERDELEAARTAANHNDADFSFVKWVTRSLGPNAFMLSESRDVILDARSISGSLAKIGVFNKSWKVRYFSLSMDDKKLRYFDSEQSKKENGYVNGEDIVRISSSHKSACAFTIETNYRHYVLKASCDDSARLWIAALSVFPARNAAVLAGFITS